jgi:hypothetical protein
MLRRASRVAQRRRNRERLASPTTSLGSRSFPVFGADDGKRILTGLSEETVDAIGVVDWLSPSPPRMTSLSAPPKSVSLNDDGVVIGTVGDDD